MEKLGIYIGLAVAAIIVALAVAVTFVKWRYNLKADLSPRVKTPENENISYGKYVLIATLVVLAAIAVVAWIIL